MRVAWWAGQVGGEASNYNHLARRAAAMRRRETRGRGFKIGAPSGVGMVDMGLFGTTPVARRELGRGMVPFTSQKSSLSAPRIGGTCEIQPLMGTALRLKSCPD